MTSFQKNMIFISVLIFLFLLYVLSPVLTPFAIAAVLSYMVNPIIEKLVGFKIPRVLAVILLFILLILLFILFIVGFIPSLEVQIHYLAVQIPKMINWFQMVAQPWLNKFLDQNVSIDLNSLKQSAVQIFQTTQSVTTNIFKTITHSGMVFIGIAANLILVPVVMFYLLRDWHKIINTIHTIIPRAIEPTVVALVKECNEVLGAFFRGQLMVMLSLGCIYATGLWIIHLELALTIGLLAGLASVVPYLGFIVGISAALIAAFFQFSTWLPLLYVVIVFMVGQALESSVLTPLLVGDRIGLHPIAVIFAVLAGGKLFGFVGVLVALPVAAVIMVLLRYLKHQYMNSQIYTYGANE